MKFRLLPLVIAVSFLFGCSDNTPAKLEVGAYPNTLYDNKPVKFTASVLNKKGEAIPNTVLTYQVNPLGIAEVSNAGDVRCLSSGESTLLINGGGQSALANIKCRLISKIELPKVAVLIIGKEQTQPQPKVFNEKGAEIADASIAITTADANVVKVENGHLIPVNVGKTFATYSSGTINTTMDLAVARLIQNASGSLLLADGSASTFTLPQGNYAIEISVSPQGGGGGVGVTINTTGANCNQNEASQHKFQCSVSDTASFTIMNPTAFGMGAAMAGFVNVIEIPAM